MRTKILLASLVCFSGLSFAQDLKTGQLANITRLTNDAGVKYENPTFSPDGKQVAFTNFGYDGLYVMKTDGTSRKKISEGLGVGYMYQWSADGQEILVRDTRMVRAADGKPRSHAIWSISMDGKAERLSQDAGNMQPAAWRYTSAGMASVVADGKVVAKNRPLKAVAGAQKSLPLTLRSELLKAKYKVSFITDFDHLWVVDAAGNRKVIYNGPALAPQLSPDGSKVAFVTMQDEIKVMNIDGTGERIVGRGFHPQWVNDTQIVIERTTDDGHTYKTGELYLVNVNTKAEKALTATPGRIEMNPAISPDGKKILFSSFDDGQIYIADFK